MSTQKATVNPRTAQGKTPSVVPASREERAYRREILQHVNGLLAVPLDVCERWQAALERKQRRAPGDFSPAEFRLLIILIQVVTAHQVPDNAPRARRRTAA